MTDNSTSQHIVVTGVHELKITCRRCNDCAIKQLPASAVDVTNFIKWFQRRHSKCKPKPQSEQPPAGA